MPKPNLNSEILNAALQGLEAQRARIDAHITEVRRMLGTRSQKPAAAGKAPRPKRKMSAAALKHIVEAQRKRWAEYHQKKAEAAQKTEEPAAVKKAAPKKTAAKTLKKAAKRTAKKTAAREPKTTVAGAATQPAVAEVASE